LVKSWLEIKKLKENLGHIQIVASPREMKEALVQPLEGLWEVNGRFSKFQKSDREHYSSGYANFWWDDSLNRYKVMYSYSVKHVYKDFNCITAICYGNALVEDLKGYQRVVLNMRIESRTSNKDLPEPRSQTFEMKTTDRIQIQKELRELKFSFHTEYTDGLIIFRR